MKKIKYEVYQLPVNHENCFMRLEWCKREIDMCDYVYVYKGTLYVEHTETNYILEKIFETLNVNHPSDYHARSLSVSDVLCLNCKDFYYVDSFGFEKL